jgi:hypothetical protein
MIMPNNSWKEKGIEVMQGYKPAETRRRRRRRNTCSKRKEKSP